MNKTFVYFDILTGEISQILDIPESCAQLNLQPGQAHREVMTGEVIDPATQRMNSDGSTAVLEPVEDLGELFAQIRARRNAKLIATDWRIAADSPLSDEQQVAWRAYRQELRDLMSAITDPKNVSWPIRPDSEEA
jgi:Phage tail assembly chaperone protein